MNGVIGLFRNINMNFVKGLLIYILLLFVTPLFASDEESHSTVFFNLLQKCPLEVSNKVNKDIREKMPDIPYLLLISENDAKMVLEKNGLKPYCYNKDCAVKSTTLISGERAIIGSITRIGREYREHLGKEGENKYLLIDKSKEFYLIRIDLIDVKNDKILARIDEKTNTNGINQAVNRIIKRLAEYYKPKKIVKPEPPKYVYSALIAGSCLIPQGSFRDVANFGFGLAGDFGIGNLFFQNSALRFSAGYYYIIKKRESIDYMHQIFFSVLGGYTFSINKSMRVTPLIGAGYLFHIVSNDNHGIDSLNYYNYKLHVYNDPSLTMQCELSYLLSEKYHLIFTPGYIFFFEQNKVGSYLSLYAGVRIIL